MSNYYAKAIQVLANRETDFRALAYEIAKANPKAIAKAAERLEVGFGWQRECASLMASGLKIQAIKRCREMTGMGLEEAKDAVETLV
ncbi:MAG: ribosomal protein L7/L12 [Siphoviridae sp. ctdEk19]|nr:MAG: ribosomal protein L7/L12 [Siphoviridae sp. ctdEk19]